MLMPKDDIRYLQEKYADSLENYVNSVPSQQISASDVYEHEMILPETKKMRTQRWVFEFIVIIVFIILTIPFLYIFVLSSSPINFSNIFMRLVVLSLIVFFWRWAVISIKQTY